jgi:hypothetical protein
VGSSLLAPLTIFFELDLTLNLLLILAAPIVNTFTILTGQFN